MSIEASYRRLPGELFKRLRSDPKAAATFFDTEAAMLDQDRASRFLSLAKDWHAMHFLLTGDGELRPHPAPPAPLGNVVQGGQETSWDCTYGKIRFLSPAEVQAVADALVQIPVETLRSRFDAATFNQARIYPHGRKGQWTDAEAESVFEVYPRLVEFFRSAAAEGDFVLLSSD